MTGDDYALTVVEHFLALRGKGSAESSRDQVTIEAWEAAEVPVALVLDGISLAFERKRDKPKSVTECGRWVRQLLAQPGDEVDAPEGSGGDANAERTATPATSADLANPASAVPAPTVGASTDGAPRPPESTAAPATRLAATLRSIDAARWLPLARALDRVADAVARTAAPHGALDSRLRAELALDLGDAILEACDGPTRAALETEADAALDAARLPPTASDALRLARWNDGLLRAAGLRAGIAALDDRLRMLVAEA